MSLSSCILVSATLFWLSAASFVEWGSNASLADVPDFRKAGSPPSYSYESLLVVAVPPGNLTRGLISVQRRLVAFNGAVSLAAVGTVDWQQWASSPLGSSLDNVTYEGNEPPLVCGLAADRGLRIAAVGTTYNAAKNDSSNCTSQQGSCPVTLKSEWITQVGGTTLDMGALWEHTDGMTVTFSVKASSTSRGFVVALSDALVAVERKENLIVACATESLLLSLGAPAAENSSQLLCSGAFAAIKQSRQCGGSVALYMGVFLYGPTSNLMWVTVGRDGALTVVASWEDARLFDGGWHSVALLVDNSEDDPTVQLFRDGESSYLYGRKWLKCAKGVVASPILYDGSFVATRINNDSVACFPHGMLVVGAASNISLFSIQMYNELLSRSEIIELGSVSMRSHRDLTLTAAVILGVVFASVAVTLVVLTIFQYFFEIRSNVLLSGAPTSIEAKFSAVQAATKAVGTRVSSVRSSFMSTSPSGVLLAYGGPLKRASLLLPLYSNVEQGISLYFRNWKWPPLFFKVASWFAFLFAIDFIILPVRIPVYVTLALQLVCAIVGLAFVRYLYYNDEGDFDQAVTRFRKSQQACRNYLIAIFDFHLRKAGLTVNFLEAVEQMLLEHKDWDEEEIHALLPSVPTLTVKEMVASLGPFPQSAVEAALRETMFKLGYHLSPTEADGIVKGLISSSVGSSIKRIVEVPTGMALRMSDLVVIATKLREVCDSPAVEDSQVGLVDSELEKNIRLLVGSAKLPSAEGRPQPTYSIELLDKSQQKWYRLMQRDESADAHAEGDSFQRAMDHFARHEVAWPLPCVTVVPVGSAAHTPAVWVCLRDIAFCSRRR